MSYEFSILNFFEFRDRASSPPNLLTPQFLTS